MLHYCLAQDFIVKGTLNLKCLKFRVLDEADEMLNMGFVDDVDALDRSAWRLAINVPEP